MEMVIHTLQVRVRATQVLTHGLCVRQTLGVVPQVQLALDVKRFGSVNGGIHARIHVKAS